MFFQISVLGLKENATSLHERSFLIVNIVGFFFSFEGMLSARKVQVSKLERTGLGIFL